MAVYSFKDLWATNRSVEMFMADYSGFVNLEQVVNDTLQKLMLSDSVQSGVRLVQGGNMSKYDFDGWFSEIVNLELRNALGVLRNKAIQKALAIGAHDAAYAISRRIYKNRRGGNINIAGHHGRLSNRRRLYTQGSIKPRHVSQRTRNINEYYGPDRDFILRFLEGGTDVRTAKSFGPTGRGSTASWGNRGSISPRPFFQSMGSDMEMAAQQLGKTLAGRVEEWIDKAFKEE